MGAVSGLGDVKHAAATEALIAALPNLTEGNRKLAIAALLRDDARIAALREALKSGKVDASQLNAEQKSRLDSAANK